MKTNLMSAALCVVLALCLSACGNQTPAAEGAAEGKQTAGSKPETSAPSAPVVKTISYLSKTYNVPVPAGKIAIAGALEAMEDALVLGVQPVGATTTGGKFPDMFKPIMGAAQPIGEKTQPNVEAILKLEPDIVLGSTKFPPEVSEKLAKIGPMIPISHIATDWEANLRLLGELTGKQAQAEQLLKQYKDDLQAAKSRIGEKWKGKQVISVRIRNGAVYVYPADVYFNPTLYGELGLEAPEPVKAAKAQQLMSLEQLSALNPDAILVQFSEEENKDHSGALTELQNNPVWKSLNAVKTNKVFVNIIDPIAQGGTSWSKINFLQAVVQKLSE